MMSGTTADLLLDVLLLASILGLGALATYCLLDEWATLRIASLAFPIGSGVLTWLIFVASWAGLHLSVAGLALVLAGSYAVCLIIVWRRRRSRGPRPQALVDSGGHPSEPSPRILVWLIGATGSILVVANLLIAVSSSYSLWDSIAIWSLQGYGIAHAGSVFGAVEGAHGLAYPMNIPLQVALFTLAGGDLLPGSKTVFSLYFLSLLLGVYVFSRGHGMSRAKAGLATLGLATMPALFTESTSGYANAPMVVYLALGGMALLDGVLRSSRRDLLLGGLLLGLAGWTRIEGILYVGGVVVVGLAVLALFRRPEAEWGWSLVPPLVLAVPWFVFYRLYGAEGSQSFGSITAMLASIGQGDLHLGPLRLVLQEALLTIRETKMWGWVWIPIVLIPAVCYRGVGRRQRISYLAVAAMGAATAGVAIGLSYVASFGLPGFANWLDVNFHRFWLPFPVIVWIGTLVLLARPLPDSPGEAEA